MQNESLELLYNTYKIEGLKSIAQDEEYPVPLEKICSTLGIRTESLPISDDISGRIYYLNNMYFIEANSTHAPTRRRFTVAHELGHYCLHKEFLDNNGMILERSHSSLSIIRDKEIEADTFAAELLMPKKHFAEKYGELKRIDALAEYFFVSIGATQTRLNVLSKNNMI